MAVAALVVIGLGVILVVAGLVVSLVEFQRSADKTTFQNEPLALSDTITALEKLALALLKHRLGMQLIIVGVLLIIIGGVIGGIAGLS